MTRYGRFECTRKGSLASYSKYVCSCFVYHTDFVLPSHVFQQVCLWLEEMQSDMKYDMDVYFWKDVVIIVKSDELQTVQVNSHRKTLFTLLFKFL